MPRFAFVAVLLLAAAVPGCSEPKSRISGKVTRNGKPVTAGLVVFFPPDNMTYTAEIRPDGSYDCPACARGKVRVAVQLPLPRVAARPNPGTTRAKSEGGKAAADDDKGKMARQAAPADTPPADTPPADTADFTTAPPFADPKTSGLAFDLDAAEFVFDIAL